MIKRCPTIALACWVLVVVTSASAECAWVLWMHSTGYPSPSREWEVQTALQRREDCLRMLDAREKLAPKQGDWTAITRNANTDLFLQAGTSITTFKCLPDTVDHAGRRGSKGESCQRRETSTRRS